MVELLKDKEQVTGVLFLVLAVPALIWFILGASNVANPNYFTDWEDWTDWLGGIGLFLGLIILGLLFI